MDSNALAPLIPVVAIAAYAAVRIAKIQAQGRTTRPDPQLSERLGALEEELGSLRQGLSEAHERLDFAERLLAQQRTAGLPPPERPAP